MVLLGRSDQSIDRITFLDARGLGVDGGWECLAALMDSTSPETIHFADVRHPLYFYVTDGCMTIATSLKTLSIRRHESGLPVEVDQELRSAYRDAGLVLPPLTILRDIFQVPLYSTFHRRSTGYVLEFTGIARGAAPFQDDDAVFRDLRRELTEAVKGHDEARVVCTLSGGADSATLLSVVCSVVAPARIRTLTCRMPGFDGEVDRARRISDRCGVENLVYEPEGVDAAAVADEYVARFGNLVYDPVVPVLTSMLRTFDGDIPSGRPVLIVEGQGADTVLAGLPHNAALALYSRRAARMFRILKGLLPQPSEWLQQHWRFVYRVIKTVRLLAEPTWERALLRALDFEPERYPRYYATLVSMLQWLEGQSRDRHKAIMVFFLLILQSREMQKYHLLPDGFRVVLPFMARSFVERCFATPTRMFMRAGRRKLPIVRRARALFPEIFSSVKTTPFAVRYNVASVQPQAPSHRPSGSYAQLKEHCLEALANTLSQTAPEAAVPGIVS